MTRTLAQPKQARPDPLDELIRFVTHHGRAKRFSHQLNFEPGPRSVRRQDWGRGFVRPNGEIHTWPEEYLDHEQMAAKIGDNEAAAPCNSFMIDPRGNFSMHDSVDDNSLAEKEQYIASETGLTPDAHSSWYSTKRQSMAQRSGFPELDAAVAKFMATPHGGEPPHPMGNEIEPEIQSYRDPQIAWGRCEVVAKQCAAFLRQQGFNAYAPSDELAAFDGYQNAQDTAAIGAGDFAYPEHAMVEVYGLYGPHSYNTVTIDFTASQYGFIDEFPKIEPGPSGPLIGPQRQATADYYHNAPVTERDRIMQHGLKPQVPDYAPQKLSGPFNDTQTLSSSEFMERFQPGEYGDTWDEVPDHPSFQEPNPLNPDRIHSATWPAFVQDIATNGIREPVVLDWYNPETLAEGHHRVIAAHLTGQPIPYVQGLSPFESKVSTSENGPIEDTAKMAAMTRKQLLELAQQFPDQSQTVYKWPDGWSIRQLQNYGDMHREGRLMSNCFSPQASETPHPLWYKHPETEQYQEQQGDGSWTDHYKVPDPDDADLSVSLPAEGDGVYSLRDPDNVPHVSIDYSGHAMEDGMELGRHNADPKPEYMQRVNEWADPRFGTTSGISIEPTSSWHTAQGWDPTVCNNCGGLMGEPHMMGQHWVNTCTNCGSTREVPFKSPLLNQFKRQQQIAPYPQMLQEVGPQRPWVFGKKAAVPVRMLPPDARSGLGFEGRRPMIWDPRTNGLHVGENGMIHTDVLRHMDNDGSPVAMGWIGHNPDGFPNDAIYNRGEPHEVGWYNDVDFAKPSYSAHQTAMSLAQQFAHDQYETQRLGAYDPWDPINGMGKNHRLWWRRGDFGRGLVTPTGEVYTWPEEEMTHAQRARAVGIEPFDYQRHFIISPKGQFSMHMLPGKVQPDDRWHEYIQSHTGLTPRNDGIGQQALDVQRAQQRLASWVSPHMSADNYQQDSRNWPDPTEPRAAKPPAPKGCTCQEGYKLDCPVHGLNADPELADLDHSWSVPEGSPIGYQQDTARSWQSMSSSVVALHPPSHQIVYQAASDKGNSINHQTGVGNWTRLNDADHGDKPDQGPHGIKGFRKVVHLNHPLGRRQMKDERTYDHAERIDTSTPSHTVHKHLDRAPAVDKHSKHQQYPKHSNASVVVSHGSGQSVQTSGHRNNMMNRLGSFVTLKRLRPLKQNAMKFGKRFNRVPVRLRRLKIHSPSNQ